MAFKAVGNSGGNVLKWASAGQVVEGQVLAVKNGKVFNGKQSKLAIVKTAGGDVTFPLTTVLESAFAENSIGQGALVRVTYKGMATGKAGVQYKDFTVEVDDAAPAGQASEFERLRAALIASKGAPAAESILNAARAIAKTEADQVAVLRQALGVAS